MGDVIRFRRARLTGFIPDDLGRKPQSPPADRDVWSAESLYEFAKQGEPPPPDGPSQ